MRCGMVFEPGVPAEAERAVDQGLVAADRGVGADLEVGPAQLVFRGHITHYGASIGFRPRSSLRIRGIRWLAGVCR